MGYVELILAVVQSAFDFFKPAEDVIHVYDIKKENANISLYIVMGLIFLLTIGVIVAVLVNR
ncbi:hypothetical protein [Flavihumibacter sp. CACIAM 22H1]|uniref:hypothetical protein n=1 Tax=Flavihumibacter sp. CACIAM 22H1 TaxID=1812911 RepID=UPI0007A80BC2|nr:hypothetical protein [Flavihumibacter sp. CACIAM 22H1]KYP13038.1 MAG: hypothetical protein A1D16_04860 [Flavihumibacter sp. CACIAM 22H1]